MGKLMLGFPVWSDAGVTYSPALSGGRWYGDGDLALANLQDSDLSLVARSMDADPSSSCFHVDLGTSRAVGLIAFPKNNYSTAAQVRILGQLETFLFDYEAGDDITVRGGTFARAPSGAAKATYYDRNGVVRYAPENRLTRSEDFSHADWTKANVSVAANSLEAPDGATTADTLTASSGNGTALGAVTTVAVSYTFSVWLKRKTGTGNIQITLDGTTFVTQSVTDEWIRFSVTQTGIAGSSTPGIKIVTNADAVYAWGAQVEVGSTAGKYLPTTTAAVSALRGAHFIGGVRHALLEPERENRLLRNREFGNAAWTKTNVTVTSDDATAPDATVSADKLAATATAAVEVNQSATIAATSCVGSVFGKKGSGATHFNRFTIRNVTTATNLADLSVNWDTGVVTQGTGTGAYMVLIGNYYRVVIPQTSGITSGDTIALYVGANGQTETAGNYAHLWGAQLEPGAVVSSFIATVAATVTRAADVLYFTYAALPQVLTAYVNLTEQGTATLAGNLRVFEIGDGVATEASFLVRCSSAGSYESRHDSSAGAAVTSDVSTGSAALGDQLELRAVLNADGSTLIGRSKNGASEATGSTSSALTLDGSWAATRIYLTHGSGVNGISAIRSVRVMAGVQTMATMRASVYDSGWLDGWPDGLDAEEAEGLNVPVVHIPATAQTARYWSTQVDDTANTDGEIEMARAVFAKAYTPTINISLGAQLVPMTDTERKTMDGGADVHNVKPMRRGMRFVLDDITEAEAFSDPWQIQMLAGTHKQLYAVYNQSDTDKMKAKRSFIGTLERLTALEQPHHDRHAMAFEVREAL